MCELLVIRSRNACKRDKDLAVVIELGWHEADDDGLARCQVITKNAPNRLWAAGITHVRIQAGYYDAAFVTNTFSCRIVDWVPSAPQHAVSLSLSAWSAHTSPRMVTRSTGSIPLDLPLVPTDPERLFTARALVGPDNCSPEREKTPGSGMCGSLAAQN